MLKLTKTYDHCQSKKPELTVVCVHGIADDSSRFVKPLTYLEGATSLKNVRFVCFDLLGSGKSTCSDKLNYDFKEQLEALENSINALKTKTPLVLMGHSMGCLISARFADTHKRMVKELILVSPPVFRPEEFDSPKMAAGKEGFRQLMILKDSKYKKDKAFNNELEKIVFNKHNYNVYTRLTRPTTIIYGATDQIIAGYNIPGLVKLNPKITAIKTPGTHGIGHDKYPKIVPILERILNEVV
ncbi:alpha/beta fold hydrolase [Candidatus Saccharibacteria bacterium]|nr:alpha/beta fold hydrolase [Candidatus Saccharibacteria bacterium]